MTDPARIFKALADSTRLEMVALLVRHGDLCVCDFEAVLGIGQSKASRHLRYLANAGVVTGERRGVWMYYRLREDLTEAECAVIGQVPEILGDERVASLQDSLHKWKEDKAHASGRFMCGEGPAHAAEPA